MVRRADFEQLRDDLRSLEYDFKYSKLNISSLGDRMLRQENRYAPPPPTPDLKVELEAAFNRGYQQAIKDVNGSK